MSIFDKLTKPRVARAAAVDAPTVEDVSPVGNAMAVNDAARKKQQLLLGSVAAVALLGSCWWIFGEDEKKKHHYNIHH